MCAEQGPLNTNPTAAALFVPAAKLLSSNLLKRESRTRLRYHAGYKGDFSAGAAQVFQFAQVLTRESEFAALLKHKLREAGEDRLVIGIVGAKGSGKRGLHCECARTAMAFLREDAMRLMSTVATMVSVEVSYEVAAAPDQAPSVEFRYAAQVRRISDVQQLELAQTALEAAVRRKGPRSEHKVCAITLDVVVVHEGRTGAK